MPLEEDCLEATLFGVVREADMREGTKEFLEKSGALKGRLGMRKERHYTGRLRELTRRNERNLTRDTEDERRVTAKIEATQRAGVEAAGLRFGLP